MSFGQLDYVIVRLSNDRCASYAVLQYGRYLRHKEGASLMEGGTIIGRVRKSLDKHSYRAYKFVKPEYSTRFPTEFHNRVLDLRRKNQVRGARVERGPVLLGLYSEPLELYYPNKKPEQ